MANLPLSGLPQGTTLENNATIVTVQTVGSTVVNQRIPKSLFFSQALAGALVAANNLSDIANAAIALSNLGVHNLHYSSGITAPANSLGNVGDFAFNDNFELYEKTAAATWTLRVNAVTTAEMTTAITTATTGLLTQTVADTRYAPLGESPGSGARYTFNASTTLTSIASGEIRFSSGTPASVTSIAIHESDRNGAPMATILDTIGNGAKLQIAFDANEESYCWFNVTAITDNGAYRTYTVTYLGTGTGAIAAGEVTLGIFGAAPTAGGGATGLQFTYVSTAGTPTAGQLRSANIALAGTISISATDAQSQSAADILPRIKVGAIVEISKDGANRVRGTVTADYTVGTNSFGIGSLVVYGAIANGNTVFLSIFSDAPATSIPGGSAGPIYEYPHQNSDPAAQSGKTLVWARSDGLLYARVPDGTVYPITFGASVPPIAPLVTLFKDLFNTGTDVPLTSHLADTPNTASYAIYDSFGGSIRVDPSGYIYSSNTVNGAQCRIDNTFSLPTSYTLSLNLTLASRQLGVVVRAGTTNFHEGVLVIFSRTLNQIVVYDVTTTPVYTPVNSVALPAATNIVANITVTPTAITVNVPALSISLVATTNHLASNTSAAVYFDAAVTAGERINSWEFFQ